MECVLCLLISAVMLLSGLPAMAETAEVNAAHTIEKKNVPLVIDGEVFTAAPGSRCTFWTAWRTCPTWT